MNNAKSLPVYVLMIGLILTVNPSYVYSGNKIDIVNSKSIESTESSVANNFLSRLDEIYAMDKSKMPRSEKRELRKEVQNINKELIAMENSNTAGRAGGVYLSVGAIILIVLLLIILF